MKRDYLKISVLAAFILTSTFCPAQVQVNAPTSAQQTLPAGPGGQFRTPFINERTGGKMESDSRIPGKAISENASDRGGFIPAMSASALEPAAFTAVITSQTNVMCFGDSSGSATVTAAGGVTPYLYTWSTSPVQTSATATGLVAGTYTVTVEDAIGATATATVAITQPPAPLDAEVSAMTMVMCYGDNSGTATVSVTGGTPPYSYTWYTSPQQHTATATNLPEGTYACVITDANGCQVAVAACIQQPATALNVTISAHTDATCSTTGSATASASGGTAPYSYSWNTTPVQTTATATNLPAGTYTVTVTDSSMCTATATVTIQQNVPVATITSQTNVTCSSNSGSATVSASGGTAPYTYSWSTNPVQTTATASNLSVGSYTATVTDANNCTATATVSITQSPSTLSASISSHSNVTCLSNGGNGSATVTASGGTSPYTYSWSTTPVQTTATANNLTAGNYTVTVTDANSCTATATVSISVDSMALMATILAQTNVDCYGNFSGSVTVGVSGGVGPYNYSWNLTSSQAATISNIPAGTYSFSVTDSAGCSASLTITITQPAAPLSANISGQTNATCSSGGSATVTATGGTAPYYYSWNSTPAQTGATASNLPPGNYAVAVTDANGCTATATVSISQSNTLTASISAHTDVNCSNPNSGSATVTASGGTMPYTYNWSSGGTAATENNLAVGNYTVTVTDAGGCTATAMVSISQSSTLTASISAHTDVNCANPNGGSATVTASGGTAPYTYNWSSGGTAATENNLAMGNYTVTVTDAGGCTATATVAIGQNPNDLNVVVTSQTNVSCYGDFSGSISVSVTGGVGPYFYSWNMSSQTSTTVSNIPAGTYSFTVFDSGTGCSASLVVNITQPAAPLAANATATNPTCAGNDGAISISASGGTTPYAFAWSGPSGYSSTSQNISGLASGTYSLTITDANGCTQSLTQTLTAPQVISLTSSVTSTSCTTNTGGAIDLSVSGGATPYVFAWSGPNNFSASTEDVSGLVSGNYTVTVTDANGCSGSSTIAVNQSAGLSLTLTSAVHPGGQNISCAGGHDGSINLTVIGGSPAFTYAWSGPNNFSGSTEDLLQLFAGNYSVVVTDANGCQSTATISLSQPAQPVSATHLIYDVNCAGNTTGGIDLTVNGGSPVYTYLWTGPGNFNASTQDISNLAAGTYTIFVNDINGCTFLDSMDVTQPTPIVVSGQLSNYNGVNVSCAGSTDGYIDLSATGGASGFTFNWSGPQNFSATTEDITSLAAGVYSVTATDAAGCAATATFVLSAPLPIDANASITNANCANSGGAIDLNPNGGIQPYTYNWSTGSTQEDLTALNAGEYIVLVSDANHCSVHDTINIDQNSFTISGVTANASCAGPNSSITLTMINGMSPYTFAWSNGATVQDLINIGAGVYVVVATDSLGCTATDTFHVTEPQPIYVGLFSPAVVGTFNVSSPTASDGSINLTIEGGNPPYTYVWSNGATTQDLSGVSAGTYSVVCTDAMGCTDTAFIALFAPGGIEMPTGYSPNGDGQNDYFVIHGLESYPNNRIEVYNRWGNLVYEATNYTNHWDGRTNSGDALPDATYFVVFKATDSDLVLKNYVDIRR